MSQYHEPLEDLDSKARDITRALNSLKEEIEAVDWYGQRVAASSCPELKAIMAHNRDEEIEHAVMTIEWLRRNMGAWDKELRTYLFKTGDITKLEEQAMSGENGEDAEKEKSEYSLKKDSSLDLGDLK